MGWGVNNISDLYILYVGIVFFVLIFGALVVFFQFLANEYPLELCKNTKRFLFHRIDSVVID